MLLEISGEITPERMKERSQRKNNTQDRKSTRLNSSHTHNWVLFLLSLHLFILSGVISPLISSSILGSYQPGGFIFHCAIFLPFLTVHGVLKGRILKWFVIPFFSGLHFFRTLQRDPPFFIGPTQHGS